MLFNQTQCTSPPSSLLGPWLPVSARWPALALILTMTTDAPFRSPALISRLCLCGSRSQAQQWKHPDQPSELLPQPWTCQRLLLQPEPPCRCRLSRPGSGQHGLIGKGTEALRRRSRKPSSMIRPPSNRLQQVSRLAFVSSSDVVRSVTAFNSLYRLNTRLCAALRLHGNRRLTADVDWPFLEGTLSFRLHTVASVSTPAGAVMVLTVKSWPSSSLPHARYLTQHSH